jgi:hypothetical protein
MYATNSKFSLVRLDSITITSSIEMIFHRFSILCQLEHTNDKC